MKKKIWKYNIIGMIMILPLIPGIRASDNVLVLKELINEALSNNPQLQASYYAWQESEKRESQADALPDPVLGISVVNMPTDSYLLNQEPMTGKQISLMQMIPFPGKLGLKEKIAGQESYINEMRYLETKNALIEKVKSVYYELYCIDKAILKTDKNAALMRQFTRIAETRYRVGQGLQQDVLRANVEQTKISEKLIRMRQQHRNLMTQLKQLLNRQTDEAVTIVKTLPDSIRKVEWALLIEMADANRPLLKLHQALIRRSDFEINLAKKSYFPDFNVGVTYTQRDILKNQMGGVDYLSGSVQMTLPLYFFKKQSKRVQESQLRMMSAEKSYENIRTQVHQQIEAKIAEVEQNKKLLSLYKSGIIVRARQAVNSALSAYQVDKVDFLSLLSSQMTLYNYELDYERVLSDYHKSIAQLERLVGRTF